MNTLSQVHTPDVASPTVWVNRNFSVQKVKKKTQREMSSNTNLKLNDPVCNVLITDIEIKSSKIK